MTNEAGRKDLDLKGRLNKRLAGAGIEIGGGVGTDIATTPLLGMGPVGIATYSAINAFQGAYTNYHVQKFVNPGSDETLITAFISSKPFATIDNPNPLPSNLDETNGSNIFGNICFETPFP